MKRILERESYNPRWLEQINPRMRQEAEETLAVLVAAAQKLEEVSP